MGKEASSAHAERYVSAVLADLGIAHEAPTSLDVTSFAGVAGDGRDVASLLYGSVIQTVKAQYAPGMSELGRSQMLDRAVAEGLAWLESAATTVMADTARAAESAALAQRPWVRGWVRMIEPGACSRCVILAGKFYLYN